MKLALLLEIVILVSCRRNLSAAEIMVRLVDIGSGAGRRNCEVTLMGGNTDQPRDLNWLPGIHFQYTQAGGYARFHLTDPLPAYISVPFILNDCLQCGSLAMITTEQLLLAGATSKMDGRNSRGNLYCHPNLSKLKVITPVPGEVVIFVRKVSFWEKVFMY
jgi:hypothetical protein